MYFNIIYEQGIIGNLYKLVSGKIIMDDLWTKGVMNEY